MSEQGASSGWVETKVTLAMEEWQRASARPEPFLRHYSLSDQKTREKAYDCALDAVRLTCRRRHADAEERLTRAFARFGAEALDLGASATDLLTHGFLPVGKQLARWAHRFDSSLSHRDITQAARNAWTACGMQPLFGSPLRLTPSILAYSLLYPYSDNYLDRPDLAREDKVSFSRRFRSRLRGEALLEMNSQERSIWALVRMIEEEFPRADYPDVFEALLAIHEAQEESLRQLEDCGHLDERELLRISCAKGGTSVLADAYLVRGTLDDLESEFAFLWGVLLQLGDDLQDIGEDLQRGSDTLFTRAIRKGRPIDQVVKQLLSLSTAVGVRTDALPNGSAMHKELLKMSWRSLIVMAVGEARAYCTPGFLAYMERCSPFRFVFLRNRRKKLAADKGLFLRVFESVLRAEDQDETEGGTSGWLLSPEETRAI